MFQIFIWQTIQKCQLFLRHSVIICKLLCSRWKNQNSLKLSHHKVYFSATGCKWSLLYDQTIEDINIFSSAFLVELRGWLKLPHSPLHAKKTTHYLKSSFLFPRPCLLIVNTRKHFDYTWTVPYTV